MLTLSCAIMAITLLLVLVCPFWIGEGGRLVRASTIDDPGKIDKIKDVLVKRYLDDEKAHSQGHIGSGEWRQRKEYLSNRYIDLSRRHDFLCFNESSEVGTRDKKGNT